MSFRAHWIHSSAVQRNDCCSRVEVYILARLILSEENNLKLEGRTNSRRRCTGMECEHDMIPCQFIPGCKSWTLGIGDGVKVTLPQGGGNKGDYEEKSALSDGRFPHPLHSESEGCGKPGFVNKAWIPVLNRPCRT